MRKQLWALLLVCSCQLATAQDTLAPLVADHLQRAYQLTNSAEFEAALKINHQALDLYESYPLRDDSLLADVYNNISVQHYYLGDYREAIRWMEKVLSTREQLYGDSSTQIAMAYNNMGVFHFHRGDFRSASEFYQQALDIYALVGDEKNYHLSECYSNVGACCALMGDYGKAKDYFEKGLVLRIETLADSNSVSLTSDYNNLGGVYKELGEYDISLRYLYKALRIRKENQSENYFDISNSYSNIGIVYAKTGQYKKAVEAYNKAISLRTQLPKKSRFDNHNSYFNLGEVYVAMSKYNKAEEAYRQSKSILQSSLDNNDPAVLKILLREANIKQLESKYLESLSIVEEVMSEYCSNDFKYLDFSKYSSLPFLLESLIEYRVIVELLWNVNNDITRLNLAIDIGRTILNLLDHMRFSYEGEISRLSIIEENISQYESHIRNCLDAYQLTNDPDYLKEAFSTAERAQCRQLLEGARRQQAVVYARIPERIQTALREQAIALTSLEAKINGSEEDLTKVDTQRMRLLDQRFDLKQQRKELLERTQEQYPVFYQMLYDESVVDIAYIQDILLNTDQALLSYFQGDDRYYLFFLDSHELRLFPLAETHALDKKISKFRDLVSKELPSSDTQDTLIQLSYALYQELIAPVARQLPKRLVIIPGGKLALLPFESLMREANGTHVDYLVHKHSIAYVYSATWWKSLARLSETETDLQPLLAVAPDFRESLQQASVGEVHLASLEYHQSEVEVLQAMIGGKVLQNRAASLTNFLKEAGDYRLLHLATHAVVDGDDSYLAFSPQEGKSRLYLPEIYNLDLQSEMVVLSACETGLGHLRQGEGIFSLARAFSYAGAQSLVTSLWEVEDRTTTRIMQEFYRQLKKGLNKDEALRQAQIQFLQNCRRSEIHPYHWAGFVPYGRMTPIRLDQNGTKNWLIEISSGIFLAGIGIGFYLKRRRRLN